MSREPSCSHGEMSFRVTSHDTGEPITGAHASVWVCARARCVADAKEWVTAKTGRPPKVFDRDGGAL